MLYSKAFATASHPPSHKATAGRRFSLGMTNAFASLPSTMRASHLEDFYQFLRFPSVSTDDHYTEKVTECGHWLVEKLTKIGLSAKLCPTPGHPVVWAQNKQKSGRPTVLIYGHYDVQPPDPVRLWDSPPFEPVLKNGYVFARGATDNKGQILSHILGVQEQIEAAGDLPVNLHFVIEGEEEIGSANLGNFLSQNREALKPAIVVVSDTGMISRGVPTMSYGLRGGYQGQGTKTVIGREAMAKLTFRLVPNQNGEKIIALVQEYLQKNCPSGVKLDMAAGHAGPWYLTDPHSQYGEAAQRALKKAFERDPVLIREGGSIPIVSDFRDILGAETLLLGLALPDCRAHSPNENFPLDNLDAGIRLNKAMLQELAD